MNENINLCEILKDCPVGTEFYHAGYGTVVKFVDIDLSSGYPILLALHNNPRYHYANLAVTEKGAINADYEGECLLFPSKDQRDWSKFKRFWDKSEVERFNPEEFKPFDKVLLRDGYGFQWCPAFLEKILKGPSGKYSAVELINGCKWDMCIPYNEETKHLCWTTKDCPDYYKWWKK